MRGAACCRRLPTPRNFAQPRWDGGSLEGKLAAAAKAGFRVVELFENDLTFFNGKAREGTYMTVWEKQPDGTWKVLFDTGDPD